jgi:predicted GIY-YIG superfamily endonuclease
VTGAPEPASRETAIDGEPTALYRFYDGADVLLYVGISRNPAARWAQHAAEKTWWPRVAKKTVVMYGSRQEAEIAEGKAIRSESPLHNIAMGRADPEAQPARKLPLRKSAAPRKPASRQLPPREAFRLDPFIRAYAVSQECTYAEAESKLIWAGIIHDYMERFADPEEGIAALQKDMDAQKRLRLPRSA